MAEYTQNYNLYKPNRNDPEAVDTTLTTNFQTIDEEIKKRETDIANLTTNFESKTTELDTKIDSESLNLKEQIDTKTTMLQNQVDGLVVNGDSSPAIAQALAGTPFGTLREKLDSTDAQLAQTTTNLNDRSINVLDPPKPLNKAEGDGIADDYEALQSIIDYCYEHNITVFFPSGTYNISKPLVIYGGIEETDVGSRLEGVTREKTIIRKTTNDTLTTGTEYDVDAIIITANKTMDVNLMARSINFKNIGLDVQGVPNVEYGIYARALRMVSWSFDHVLIKNAKNGFYIHGENYLNEYNFIRIEDCINGLYHESVGSNTSNTYKSCYVLRCKEVAYQMFGSYMTVISPAVDGCEGTCYRLGGFIGTLVSPGAESPNANFVFDFGELPLETNCVVVGASTSMLRNSYGTHVRLGLSQENVTFVGGAISRKIWNNPSFKAPGKLFDTVGNNNTLNVLGTLVGPFENIGKLPTNRDINLIDDNNNYVYHPRLRGALVRFGDSATQIIPKSVNTPVNKWNVIEYDTEKFMTDSTHFTIPENARFVKIMAQIRLTQAMEGRIRVRVNKVGASDQEYVLAPKVDLNTKVTTINLSSPAIKVNAGDKFYIEIFHENATDITLYNRAENWFSIEVID